jgi:hypothetical protein
MKKKSTTKSTTGTRCEPNVIIQEAECLSREAKDFVKGYGFCGVLQIKKLYSVETLIVLMDKCDVSTEDESFTIAISEERNIKVTSKVIHHILGIVAGDLIINDKWEKEQNWSKMHSDFTEKLKAREYDVTSTSKFKGKETENPCLCVKEFKRYIKFVEDMREEARVFLSTVLCKLLLPA